jgi:hypothetical protein
MDLLACALDILHEEEVVVLGRVRMSCRCLDSSGQGCVGGNVALAPRRPIRAKVS